MALTITVYMVVQGVAPSIWAPFADVYGRRIIILALMTVYLVANAILGATKDFASLMIFRGFQAAGSAALMSIGKPIDHAPTAETP